MVLRTLLDALTRRYGGYEIVAHWTQGDAHHDVVVMLPASATRDVPGRVLVVATNGNAIIKEVMAFAVVPTQRALWHLRCPHLMQAPGDVAPILAHAKTEHWVDPSELVKEDARDPGVASAGPFSAAAPTELAPSFDEPPTQRSG